MSQSGRKCHRSSPIIASRPRSRAVPASVSKAQRAAVKAFAEAEGFEIVAEYTEIETGKGADALDRRPELKAALKAAKKAKC